MNFHTYITGINIRQRLFAGTLAANKNEFAGTVPANKDEFAGTVPVNKNEVAGTIPENEIQLLLFDSNFKAPIYIKENYKIKYLLYGLR